MDIAFSNIYSEEGLVSCSSFSNKIDRFVGDNIALGEKVDFLINFFNACKTSELTMFSMIFGLTFLSVFLSSILSILILILIKLPTYRFLLFTEASKKEREKYLTRISTISWWKNFWLVTVFLGSIIAFLNRILGNYL